MVTVKWLENPLIDMVNYDYHYQSKNYFGYFV